MNKKTILSSSMVIAAVLTVIIALGFFRVNNSTAAERQCGMMGMSHDKADKPPMTKTDSLMTAKTLYTCPMHPEFVSANKNEKCTICGMKTEKMSDEKMAEFHANQAKQTAGQKMDHAAMTDSTHSGMSGMCPMMDGSHEHGSQEHGQQTAGTDSSQHVGH